MYNLSKGAVFGVGVQMAEEVEQDAQDEEDKEKSALETHPNWLSVNAGCSTGEISMAGEPALDFPGAIIQAHAHALR